MDKLSIYSIIQKGNPGQKKKKERKNYKGTSLAVQWLRLCTSSVGGAGSIPGRGTKIPHAAGPPKKGNPHPSLGSGLTPESTGSTRGQIGDPRGTGSLSLQEPVRTRRPVAPSAPVEPGKCPSSVDSSRETSIFKGTEGKG